MMISRTLKKSVLAAAKDFKIVLVTGARQVGKTTLLKNLAETGRHYVSLDDPEERRLANEEPNLFFQLHELPIIIDEVQYAPKLFPYLKMLADDSAARGKIWLTGSQQFQLMQQITESLAGRVAVLDLMGLSLAEAAERGATQKPFVPKASFKTTATPVAAPKIFEAVWRGSFPQARLGSARSWRVFYESYLRTYIERDVRQLSQIGDELAFLRFLKVAAARTAQTLNYAELARDADISPLSAKKWISILCASGITYLLQPYYKNITKRIVKAPKLYFCDTGLCAFLCAWTSPETLANGAMAGAIFETFAVMEILKSHRHNGIEPQLFYVRDNNALEIDLLIEQNGTLFPVEIKKTGNPDPAMVKTFEKFKNTGIDNLGYGALVCLCDKPRPLTKTVAAVPVWTL